LACPVFDRFVGIEYRVPFDIRGFLASNCDNDFLACRTLAEGLSGSDLFDLSFVLYPNHLLLQCWHDDFRRNLCFHSNRMIRKGFSYVPPSEDIFRRKAMSRMIESVRSGWPMMTQTDLLYIKGFFDYVRFLGPGMFTSVQSEIFRVLPAW